MPLRDDLLNPVPGDNPSGIYLRYDKVYDQIKEARTEDDDSIPAGAWERAPKKADFALVIKLAGEAFATRSKDMQLAAWLAEAYVKREGLALIAPSFKLMQDLQEQFWDTFYPEIEDGDVGMRAMPIEWAANRIATLVREAPITKKGLNYYQYKESRSVGYDDPDASDSKREARNTAIEDGKVTGEEFDEAFASTSKSFYVSQHEAMQSALETIEAIQPFCEEKYGDDGPSFSKLRTSIEEVDQVLNSLLNEKRKTEPDEAAEQPVEVAEEEEEPEAYEAIEDAEESPAPKAAKKSKSVSAEPADWDDAISRIRACALFMQKERSSSPVPYLLQTAMRLGEMREQGSYASYDFLASPATETRQTLKRLSAEANWEELLREAVSAAGDPAGRAWLDVQRYIWKASYEYGHSAISAAVIATLQSLLKDIPELPTWSLDDDTPTANPETLRWLEEMVIPKPSEPVAPEASEPEPVYASRNEPTEEGEAAPPDVFDLARDMIRRGQLSQAIQLLVRDAAQQPSGRARFQRRLQIAQLCIGAGQSKVAHPVLEELVKEIEQRNLEEWEASEMIASPLALLLKCLDPSEDSNGKREALFSKLCRIDPIAAMDVSH